MLAKLKHDIQKQRRIRQKDASRLVAELLVDAASWHLSSAPGDEAVEHSTQILRRKIRQREAECVKALLRRYNFRQGDFTKHTLPLQGERSGMDLFHPQALTDSGLHVGKGAAAGVGARLRVDIFTAGPSPSA